MVYEQSGFQLYLYSIVQITEARLRELFSEQGVVTDVQLKYTKEGVFRQFAFVGYQSEEQAAAATIHFHRSCIQTNRIVVEPCVALGAETKPKSWSKYAADSSAFKKINQVPEEEDEVTGKKAGDKKKKKSDDEKSKKEAKPVKKVSKVEALLAPHKDDPQFVEFMKTHAKGKGIWENDWDLKEDDKEAPKPQSDEEKDEDSAPEDEDSVEEPEVKLADTEISDADYMKSLQQKKTDAETTKTSTKPANKKSKESEKSDPSQLPDLLTIKIRNIPFKTKRQDVLNFFKPLKPFSVRLPTKVHGIVYVGFKLEADFKKAMLKDRSFWSESLTRFTFIS